MFLEEFVGKLVWTSMLKDMVFVLFDDIFVYVVVIFFFWKFSVLELFLVKVRFVVIWNWGGGRFFLVLLICWFWFWLIFCIGFVLDVVIGFQSSCILGLVRFIYFCWGGIGMWVFC